MNRRHFIEASAMAGAATLAGTLAPGCSHAPRAWNPAAGPVSAVNKPPRGQKFGISLAEWSLHKTLFAKKLDHLDFPKAARRDFGIEAIELVNQFFKDKATDAAYLAEFKKRSEGEGVRILLIMVDGEGALGDPNPVQRRKAVANHHKWAQAAKALGCHSIRVNAETQGVGGWEEQEKRAADGLAQLSDYCAGLGLNCIVENHGHLSSHGQWLAGVMRRVNKPNCGTLPDFGNFLIDDKGTWYDRYQGVAELMPFAKAVSAKSHDFDAAGNCIQTDYRRMLQVVLNAGYRGFVGIEYEGDKLPEADGINATKVLLERVRAELG
ncbi:MAG: sugar phosphate isomerase/epimerase family protein [Verrucomicrobiota bacterium]